MADSLINDFETCALCAAPVRSEDTRRTCTVCGLITDLAIPPNPVAPPVQRWWSTVLDQLLSGQTLLDLGGPAGFAEAARAAGWNVTRADSADPSALSGLPARAFDAVTYFDQIQDADMPDQVLREVARVLAPGGALFVTCRPRASGAAADPDDPIATPRRHAIDRQSLWRGLDRVLGGAEVRTIEIQLVDGARLGAIAFARRRRAESIVLFANRNDCFDFTGGDTTQMCQTARALEALGIGVDFCCGSAPTLDPERHAVGHVFNLQTPDVALDQVRTMRSAGKPVVLSSVYWVHDEIAWAEPALQGLFLENQQAELRDQYLGALARRVLSVNDKPLILGRELDAVYQGKQQELLRSVDRVLPNSLTEMRELSRNLGAADVPFTIVPNAVDPDVFAHASPDWFVETYGLRDFVCVAGRIDVRKNQLLLLYALREIGIPIVVIGNSYSQVYIDVCKRWAPPWTTFIPHLAPARLASAFRAARVHALASWYETPGLGSLEAAVAGCALVVGNRAAELEYFQDDVDYCDPADVVSIRDAVLRAYLGYDASADRRARLRERILQDYTWEKAGAATARAYEQARAGTHVAPRKADVASSPAAAGPGQFALFVDGADERWSVALRAYVDAFGPADGTRLTVYLPWERPALLGTVRQTIAALAGRRADIWASLMRRESAEWLSTSSVLLVTGDSPNDLRRARRAIAARRRVVVDIRPEILRRIG